MSGAIAVRLQSGYAGNRANSPIGLIEATTIANQRARPLPDRRPSAARATIEPQMTRAIPHAVKPVVTSDPLSPTRKTSSEKSAVSPLDHVDDADRSEDDARKTTQPVQAEPPDSAAVLVVASVIEVGFPFRPRRWRTSADRPLGMNPSHAAEATSGSPG